MAQPSTNQDALAAVRIVLVAPAGPLNVGSVARVMKNFGLSQLVLVNPQCDPLGVEALQMAVHADDILRAAKPRTRAVVAIARSQPTNASGIVSTRFAARKISSACTAICNASTPSGS
ncbi:MAG: TrmH family RNA methyltransferase, partial [Cyanobacteria bacterium J06643_4]